MYCCSKKTRINHKSFFKKKRILISIVLLSILICFFLSILEFFFFDITICDCYNSFSIAQFVSFHHLFHICHSSAFLLMYFVPKFNVFFGALWMFNIIREITQDPTNVQRRIQRGCWGWESTPGIWGFRNGAKPDFCLLDFSYYYEHPRIQKAIYSSAWLQIT